MAFQKGHKKIGGRTAGTPNAATAEWKALKATFLSSPEWTRAEKRELLRNPSGALSLFIHQHLYGKPTEVLDVQHSGGVILTWRTRPSK